MEAKDETLRFIDEKLSDEQIAEMRNHVRKSMHDARVGSEAN